jgi:hypothetical protein
VALGELLSQSKIKIEKKPFGLEVRMTLEEIKSNSAFGSEGVKNFLEFYQDEPGDKIVVVNMEDGSLKLDGAETPEAKSEIEPLVN